MSCNAIVCSKSPRLGLSDLRKAFAETELFEDKTWQYSPTAFPLTDSQVEEIEAIGHACVEFHRAVELLYHRSSHGKNLLRNRQLEAPWVAEYYDRGKPRRMREFNRSRRWQGCLPPVFRPDLLITGNGFALTEFDSIPGGIGLTSFLNRLYSQYDSGLIGSDQEMIEGFYRSLRSLAPDKSLPTIAIAISEEASTYRPEMEWLAEECRQRGWRAFCLSPTKIFPLGNSLFFDLDGNPEKIDIIYRFFELYDIQNVPNTEYMIDAREQGEVVISPPPRTIFEEKLSLALYHHHLLRDFWRETISARSKTLLDALIPRSWIMDPAPLPPGAVYVGPSAGGHPINDWRQLAEASQKERDLILKISGFHETAEGARGVLYGRDSSREEWQAGIEAAITGSETHLRILQEYRKPVRRAHPIYTSDGLLNEAQGRVRVCPYYFVQNDSAILTGALATFCPADKKIIHGMRDAALLPCRRAPNDKS